MPKFLSHRARYATALLLACSVLCTAENTKPAHPHRDQKKLIQQKEDIWRNALLAGNPAPLESIIADDFLGIGSSGTISNKAQYLENLHAGKFTFKSMDVESTDIRMLRDVAIVTSTVRIDATTHDAPYRGLFRYTRVYRLIGGDWKVINFEATRVSGSGSSEDMQRGKPLRKPPAEK